MGKSGVESFEWNSIYTRQNSISNLLSQDIYIQYFVGVRAGKTRALLASLARWVSPGAGCIEEGTIYRAPTEERNYLAKPS